MGVAGDRVAPSHGAVTCQGNLGEGLSFAAEEYRRRDM